jgi:hypothetical protein
MMSASQEGPAKRRVPNGRGKCYTEYANGVDAYDDGPGDTTVRPAPPNIPIGWYPRIERPLRRPADAPSPPKSD